MTSTDQNIRKYCLINAIEHAGKAQPKSVLGKILADDPNLRSSAMELRFTIEKVAQQVNNLTLEQQKDELKTLGGYTAPVRTERKGLPDLELTREKFTLRFAPNPNGAIHMGNARPVILCDEYAKRYNGRLILRFDDTDPKIKVPEKKFYEWIRRDLKWLKVKIYKEVICSKRLNIYYNHAEKLLKMGKAYVCTCDSEKWKNLIQKSRACPCRNLAQTMQLRRWRNMLNHKFKEGEAVLRIKTHLDDKNPAVRDWPAMRIVDKPLHPLKKAHLWPLYNFASAIDDHLLNITHIFRGQEHSTNEAKQQYLYDSFRWKYPIVTILGRFSLSESILSKSQISEGIKNHTYDSWEDLRLGTLSSLRRRGFQPDAIRQIIVDIGTKPSDITISMDNLSSYNRKIIDKTANRYFFVPNPMKIEVKGLKVKRVKLPLHPEHSTGSRDFSLSNVFYIDSEDFNKNRGLEVRLKELCNVKLDAVSEYRGTELRAVPKIQWVPEKHIVVRVSLPEEEINGYGEIALTKAKVGDIVQFERFGFVRIEKISKNMVNVVWSHE